MNIITESIDNTMKNKKVIRLTESNFHRIISESVKRVLKEARHKSTKLDWEGLQNYDLDGDLFDDKEEYESMINYDPSLATSHNPKDTADCIERNRAQDAYKKYKNRLPTNRAGQKEGDMERDWNSLPKQPKKDCQGIRQFNDRVKRKMEIDNAWNDYEDSKNTYLRDALKKIYGRK